MHEMNDGSENDYVCKKDAEATLGELVSQHGDNFMIQTYIAVIRFYDKRLASHN